MTRETIRLLPVWDVIASSDTMLEQGRLLTGCRITRQSGAYFVEFECEERHFAAPLYAVLARTRIVEMAADDSPAINRQEAITS